MMNELVNNRIRELYSDIGEESVKDWHILRFYNDILDKYGLSADDSKCYDMHFRNKENKYDIPNEDRDIIKYLTMHTKGRIAHIPYLKKEKGLIFYFKDGSSVQAAPYNIYTYAPNVSTPPCAIYLNREDDYISECIEKDLDDLDHVEVGECTYLMED